MKLLMTSTLVYLSSAALFAEAPKEDQLKKELAGLRGTWRLVSIQAPEPGNTLEELTKQGYRLVFEGSQLTVQTTDYTTRAIISVDPTHQPKRIDYTTVRDEKIKQVTYLGIYKLEGDNLTLCHNVDYFPRPTDFFPKRDQPNRNLTGVMVLKREKPMKKGEEPRKGEPTKKKCRKSIP